MAIVVGSILAACSSSTKEGDNQDPGEPTTLAANSATTQNAVVGQNAAARPSVRVTDAEGIAVPGVQVTFAVTGGGGSLTGGNQTTGATGTATVGSWTMGGAAGPNTLTATVAGLDGSPVTFTANATVSASQFNIKLTYVNPASPAQQAAFENARNRWQAVITGELSNVPINQTACGGIPINETVDDLLIFVVLDSIDGVGQVLGSAGPCLIRNSNSLAIVGRMTFDTADLGAAQANGSLTDIILHEMGHVLGIGSMWTDFDLLSNYCVGGATTAPSYIGAEAVEAYQDANGGGSATSVPVEDFSTGGCNNGTYGSHWEESIFNAELMTGFIDVGVTRPMSLTTVRSLADMGYVVDDSQADAFTADPVAPPPGLRLLAPKIPLGNDVRRGPIYSVDDGPGGTGAIRRVR